MSQAVEVDAKTVRLPLPRSRVVAIVSAVLRAERVSNAAISIAFVDNRRIAALNRRHLGHPSATDVISFALAPESSGAALRGDIYIAPEVARYNARLNGVSVREELTRLIVHGVLHVLGHDHPDGEGRGESPMWRRQEELVLALMRRRSRRASRPRRARSAE